MKTDIETIAQKIDQLEVQNRRMQIATFVVWPIVWITSVILAFVPSRLDVKAIALYLGWLQTVAIGVVIILLLFLLFRSLFRFFFKFAADFKNRNSHFSLNPGSKVD